MAGPMVDLGGFFTVTTMTCSVRFHRKPLIHTWAMYTVLLKIGSPKNRKFSNFENIDFPKNREFQKKIYTMT